MDAQWSSLEGKEHVCLSWRLLEHPAADLIVHTEFVSVYVCVSNFSTTFTCLESQKRCGAVEKEPVV